MPSSRETSLTRENDNSRRTTGQTREFQRPLHEDFTYNPPNSQSHNPSEFSTRDINNSHQDLQVFPENREEAQYYLTSERTSILQEYKSFVQKSKFIGELEAMFDRNSNKYDELTEKEEDGEALTVDQKNTLNVIKQAKSNVDTQVPLLEGEINSLNIRIQEYNHMIDAYNSKFSGNKKKIPTTDHWQNDSYTSIGERENALFPHLHECNYSEYERFQEYETDSSISWWQSHPAAKIKYTSE